jgi:hypothetical protein
MQKTIVKIEKNHNRLLTNRQKTFAELYVEGIYTNKECAIREEIVSRLADLQKQYPQVFIEGDFKKVIDDDRKESLAKS